VDRMPTMGRSSASSVKPAPLRKPRRRNSANSSSPYWASRDRNPFFIMKLRSETLPPTRFGTRRKHGVTLRDRAGLLNCQDLGHPLVPRRSDYDSLSWALGLAIGSG